MYWFNLLLLLCIHVFIIYNNVLCQVNDEDVKRSHDRMNQMMQHDGKKRVQTLDTSNVYKTIKKNHLVVILFWVNNGKEAEMINQKDMELLEITAQLFQHASVVISICEILANQKFALSAGVTYSGMMKVFNKGKVTTYSGQRSPDTLIPYLSKMMDKPVIVINTKSEKKQYDQNDLVKVITYVKKDSKEYKEVSSAALSFQPMIPFYVVHDAKLAKSFHLKKLNTLQLIKPYEKSVNMHSKGKFSEEMIVKFINENKKQRLTKMRLENIHDIWAIDMKGYVVAVFANVKTNEGNKFFSVGKSLSKQFESNVNLTFIWIDPEPFPSMVDYWQQSFEINPLEPTIGVVDVHTQTSAWYKRQPEEEYTLGVLKQWLQDVSAGKIEMGSMKPYTPPAPKAEENEEEEENEEDTKDEL